MFSWYIFFQRELFVIRDEKDEMQIPQFKECPFGESVDVLDFPVGDVFCKAVAVKERSNVVPGEWIPLRACFGRLSSRHYANASKALEMLDWNSQTLYCGHCGSLQLKKTSISKYCPQCQVETGPKLSPAVIAVIYRGDEILLVKSKTFIRDFYVLISGFVELGESFEESLRREVAEETGIELKNIRYFGSQAWPFPRNIMVGFLAEYAGGELRFQEEEISCGGWFRYDNLPKIPDKASISRRWIDAWVREREVANSCR